MYKSPDYSCDSFKEIEKLIDNLRNHYKIAFRGQSNTEYSLQTRLAHHFTKGNLPSSVNTQAQKIIMDFDLKINENKLHSEIWTDTFDFPIKNHKNEWLKIFQGQHIGIPTFVMDWSLSWEVSLFFACSADLDKSGQLWIMNLDNLGNEKSLYTKNPFSLDKYFFVRPSFEEGWEKYPSLKRFYFQQGAFLVMPSENNVAPLEERSDFKNRFILINITKKCKQEINSLYDTPVPVPSILKDIHGILESNNNYYKKYDKAFFYPEISSQLLKVVNDIRDKYNFRGG